MKIFLLIFTVTVFSLANAQQQDTLQKKFFVKANALFLPVGVLNAGFEYQLNEKMTVQGDVFISPWKSFMGTHAQIYMGILEGRYYFNSAFNKWYFGVNLGGSAFDIKKWTHINSNTFQRGFTILAGATVGYQKVLTDRWNLDFYLGGGTSQAFYHGYDETYPNNLFVYYKDSRRWNRSGEWVPYRGGVMISYQIK